MTEVWKSAEIALSAVTHNPIWFPPDDALPNGHCVSNGGNNNAMAVTLMDNLAGVPVELCQLCERLSSGIPNGHVSGMPDFLLAERDGGITDGHGAVGYTQAISGYLEEARAAARAQSFLRTQTASLILPLKHDNIRVKPREWAGSSADRTYSTVLPLYHRRTPQNGLFEYNLSGTTRLQHHPEERAMRRSKSMLTWLYRVVRSEDPALRRIDKLRAYRNTGSSPAVPVFFRQGTV